MIEDDERIIIQKSIIRTSNKFTDELMHKIELRKATEKRIKTNLLIAGLTCIVIYLLIFNLPISINLFNKDFQLSPTFVRVSASLWVLTMLRKLMDLKDLLKSW